MVGTAVNTLGAKVALKSRHNRLGQVIVNAGSLDSITIMPKRGLQLGNIVSTIAGCESRPGPHR